jgi:excisionase family DNA binding protein
LQKIKETLTTTEAARLMGFHVNTLKNWVRDNKMPAFKTLGGHYRIRTLDLVRTLRENGIPIPSQLEPRFNIAVIDEDASFQAQVKGAFSSRPGTFEIKPFLNGFDALVGIGRGIPDMIILNVRLPQMDGLQLLSKLKSNSETEAIKVLAVADNPQEAKSALAAGAADTYVKSEGSTTLVEKIKKIADDKFLDFPTL